MSNDTGRPKRVAGINDYQTFSDMVEALEKELDDGSTVTIEALPTRDKRVFYRVWLSEEIDE